MQLTIEWTQQRLYTLQGGSFIFYLDGQIQEKNKTLHFIPGVDLEQHGTFFFFFNLTIVAPRIHAHTQKKNKSLVWWKIPIGSQSNRPSRQQGLRDCYARICAVEPRACVCVCFGIGVYERVEPEQVNMFTGELIQWAAADTPSPSPPPPHTSPVWQTGVGRTEQVCGLLARRRMCNHGFIKYYRRNIIGRLTFSLWAGRAPMINTWLMLSHLRGRSAAARLETAAHISNTGDTVDWRFFFLICRVFGARKK